MYVSSVYDLGRFYVPERITENWIPHIRYIPEPPAPVRGAMNPWEQERVRVRWMGEEAAWKKIQALQQEWATLETTLARLINEYNNAVNAINERMEDLGRGSPLKQMAGYTSYASFVPGFGLIPRLMQVASFIESGIKSIFGITQRQIKDVENWMKALHQIEVQLIQTQQRMEQIMSELQQQINVAQTIASQQVVQMQADTQQSEALYQQRQMTERARAEAHRARARQAALILPRQPQQDEL